MLCVYRGGARSPGAGGGVQPCVDVRGRRGVAWAVDAPHPAGNRAGDRPGRVTASVAGGESYGVLRQVCPLAEEIADYLREVRFDLSAGTLARCGERIRAAWTRPQSGSAALRALHDRRDALQVHGWVADGFVLADGVVGAASSTSHSAIS